MWNYYLMKLNDRKAPRSENRATLRAGTWPKDWGAVLQKAYC